MGSYMLNKVWFDTMDMDCTTWYTVRNFETSHKSSIFQILHIYFQKNYMIHYRSGTGKVWLFPHPQYNTDHMKIFIILNFFISK